MRAVTTNFLKRRASRLNGLPIVNRISPPANEAPSDADIAAHLKAQLLAKEAVREVAKFIDIGWSEKQAASMVDRYLRDAGVDSFFHSAFAWWGSRTRFDGVKVYGDFLASERRIREGDVYILDVAPILDGYVCDIGYTNSLGENSLLPEANRFLQELKGEIPNLFTTMECGGDIWDYIHRRIDQAGYDNIHAMYPFSVLGHRVHRVNDTGSWLKLMNFGWQSYWSILSRGVFGQLLNRDFEGDLTGLWAIEPHIGGDGFGAKFEEILAVRDGKAWWIEAEPKALQ